MKKYKDFIDLYLHTSTHTYKIHMYIPEHRSQNLMEIGEFKFPV